MVKPKLVNKNEGKATIVKGLWNNRFGRFVPEKWKISSYEYKTKKIPAKPNWQYYILSIERIKNK